ncbi:MAG TPA: hypothetical protein VFD41_06715 [Actinomycetales bacterium]|nr:hypothetical protein [Actinomycetales bacterium]
MAFAAFLWAHPDDVPTGPPVAQDVPGPVLLVPGYGGGTGTLDPLAQQLRAAGRTAVVVEPGGDGTGDLREVAAQLDRAARALLDAGAPSVDVVGFSAGGVTARLWADELGGHEVARRVVTLGSPHHGTDVAALAAAFASASCPAACRQLVPGSDLLAGLDETPDGPRWVSIWTAQDRTVTPPDSARLDDAVNIELQQVCADATVAHAQLPTDPLTVELVRRALAVEPLEAAPPPSECTVLRGG